MFCVFCEFEYDFVYGKCLEWLNVDERDCVEKFVVDDKFFEEVLDGFDMSVSLGVCEYF